MMFLSFVAALRGGGGGEVVEGRGGGEAEGRDKGVDVQGGAPLLY